MPKNNKEPEPDPAATEAPPELIDESVEHLTAPWLTLSEETYDSLTSAPSQQLYSLIHDFSTLRTRPVRIHTDVLIEFLVHHAEFCIMSKFTFQQAPTYLHIVQQLFFEAILSENWSTSTPELIGSRLQEEFMKAITEEWEEKKSKLFELPTLTSIITFVGTSFLRNVRAYQFALAPLRSFEVPEFNADDDNNIPGNESDVVA